jgi:hypothetical protein
MTELDCLDERETPDSVGMGSYTIDSHNVQRYVTPDGDVQNEGDIGVPAPRPYEIAYGALAPKKPQCQNLVVPICVSSSHIAYGSIRMEPVFMILGQSAATAACLSLDAGVAVQDLPYAKLRERLLADGQVLESEAGTRSISAQKLEGVVVDDRRAQFTGDWKEGAAVQPFVDRGYRHDGNASQGELSARFTANLSPGRYDVRITYSASSNRATNVPVAVHHQGGTTTVKLNQRQPPTINSLSTSVGVFTFGGPAVVVITNEGTDGHVIVDAVQFVPMP